MYEFIGGLIGFGLAVVASKWSYASTLLRYALDGMNLAKRFGLDDKIPEWARRTAEQAIIAANQAELTALVAKLQKKWAEGNAEAKAALERGLAMSEGMDITRIEPTGDEPTTQPFAHLKRDE